MASSVWPYSWGSYLGQQALTTGSPVSTSTISGLRQGEIASLYNYALQNQDLAQSQQQISDTNDYQNSLLSLQSTSNDQQAQNDADQLALAQAAYDASVSQNAAEAAYWQDQYNLAQQTATDTKKSSDEQLQASQDALSQQESTATTTGALSLPGTAMGLYNLGKAANLWGGKAAADTTTASVNQSAVNAAADAYAKNIGLQPAAPTELSATQTIDQTIPYYNAPTTDVAGTPVFATEQPAAVGVSQVQATTPWTPTAATETTTAPSLGELGYEGAAPAVNTLAAPGAESLTGEALGSIGQADNAAGLASLGLSLNPATLALGGIGGVIALGQLLPSLTGGDYVMSPSDARSSIDNSFNYFTGLGQNIQSTDQYGMWSLGNEVDSVMKQAERAGYTTDQLGGMFNNLSDSQRSQLQAALDTYNQSPTMGTNVGSPSSVVYGGPYTSALSSGGTTSSGNTTTNSGLSQLTGASPSSPGAYVDYSPSNYGVTANAALTSPAVSYWSGGDNLWG